MNEGAVLGDDEAVAGLALGAAGGGLGRALDAQGLGGELEVAVVLLQGLLALHHPRAGEVAELLDVCSGDRCHGVFLLLG